MSDVTYRICSNVKRLLLPSKDETIERRQGRIKRWTTVASNFEITDKDGNITYRDF
jgi:hypothetical protein